MAKNLIHNYLTNLNNSQQSPSRRSDRSYFGLPSVNSTIEAFDEGSDKLIKPLDGKGHLINNDLIHMPKEFVRDTVYSAKALVDGSRGQANDHQLGKLNDLGLKVSGLAIATYLMTKKSTPKTKAMEFVGFGAFLASMSLWPKLALEIPARIIHGFNFRKQYIDDQGRKKYVSQDPNYIPFDLYKGDKRSEDLDVIGDRLGIRRDIPNRHEAVKDQMRKISVQNNTLWMLTAGIATPIMTALACNRMEPYIGKWAEEFSNGRVNAQINDVHDYLNNALDGDETKSFETKVLGLREDSKSLSPLDKLLTSYKGKVVKKEDVAKLSDVIASGLDVEMQEASRVDVENLIGGDRFVANSETSKRLSNIIHSDILAKDAKLAETITPAKLESEISQGIIRGAVKDMLASVGSLDSVSRFDGVAQNFKRRSTENIDFFVINDANKDMSPVERLAYNIKSIVLKVNNSNPSEDFISGMSDLEQRDRGLKSVIDAKLQRDSEAIARSFYEGELAISKEGEVCVRKSVQKLYKGSAKRGAIYDRLFATIGDRISAESSQHRGYVISDEVSETLSTVGKKLRKYGAVDRVLAETAHFKLEKAPETLVANNWGEVSEVFIKHLDITPEQMANASKDKAYANQLLAERLEVVCSDKKKYDDFITDLAKKMAELDEKIDAPTQQKGKVSRFLDFIIPRSFRKKARPNSTPQSEEGVRMMSKIEEGIKKNCTEAGDALGNLGMTTMRDKMLSYEDKEIGVRVGSLLNSKVERLHSRIDGVHSSYMRLIQTAEFFRRVHGFNEEVAKNTGKTVEEIADSFGFPKNKEMREQIITKGKEVLLDSHTNDFYTKLGFTNNKTCFETFFWSLYRPSKSDDWKGVWNETTEATVEILDSIKSSTNPDKYPRRVFDDTPRVKLGQKLKAHMNQVYNSLGSIEREIVGNDNEKIKVGGFSASTKRARKRFDVLGKAPSDFFHDAIKQKYNSSKWMKMFAPVLAGTFGVTLLAQFFFGKKDADIKA